MSWIGAGELSNYLSTPNSLTDLNLAWNNLRTKGGKLIFNKLADNSMVSTDLSTLNVDWNGLDSTVVGSMSRWLAESQSMQHLTFSNNNIDSNGAIELATMLEDNLAWNILTQASIL